MFNKKSVKVCIVGCGKIGYSLASQLSGSGCEVTVIDSDLNVVNKVSNSLDIITYHGNGASQAILDDAGAGNTDIFIAVTDSDELNILSCLTAHSMGAKSTIARVRNSDYAGQSEFYMEKFGLSMTINPDFAAANEIHRLIHFPLATKVELFARGRCELIEMKIDEGNSIINRTLLEINQKLRMNVLICAIVRNDNIIIPTGNTTVLKGDVLYISGSPLSINDAYKKMNLPVRTIKSVVIAGGSRIAYYLAKLLKADGVKVTLIEKVHSKGLEIAGDIPGISVMTDDAMKYFDSMTESDIKNTDAVVALTNLDEYNLVTSMYAENRNIYKVITKMNTGSTLNELVKNSKICTVSKENVAADIILGFARSVMAAEKYDSIESLYRIMDGRIEFIEFSVKSDEVFNGKPLKDLHFKKGTIIASIIRNNKIIIPRGDDYIQKGDSVLVCSVVSHISRLQDVIV